MSIFEKVNPPKDFPCSFSVGDELLLITSREHYDYLNDLANKLYQSIYGYISQPSHDYFCSSHPQERGVFATALSIDAWCADHDFNQGG